MTTKTKPCQYCGSDDTELISIPVANYVTCHACSANGPERPTPEEAVADWNRATSMAEALDHPLLRELFGEIEDSGTKEATRLWSLVAQWLEVRRAASATLTTTPAEA